MGKIGRKMPEIETAKKTDNPETLSEISGAEHQILHPASQPCQFLQTGCDCEEDECAHICGAMSDSYIIRSQIEAVGVFSFLNSEVKVETPICSFHRITVMNALDDDMAP